MERTSVAQNDVPSGGELDPRPRVGRGRHPLSHIPPTFGVVEFTRKGSMTRWSTSVRYALRKAAEDYGPGTTDNLQEAFPDGTPAWATFNVEGSMRVTDELELRGCRE